MLLVFSSISIVERTVNTHGNISNGPHEKHLLKAPIKYYATTMAFYACTHATENADSQMVL